MKDESSQRIGRLGSPGGTAEYSEGLYPWTGGTAESSEGL